VAHKKVERKCFMYVEQSDSFGNGQSRVTAVKGGRVKHLDLVFRMAALHCNNRG